MPAGALRSKEFINPMVGALAKQADKPVAYEHGADYAPGITYTNSVQGAQAYSAQALIRS